MDIGIMKINDDANAGNPVYPPGGGQPIIVNIPQVQNDWNYNVQVGSYIWDGKLQQAQTILQNLGDTNPTNDDLIKQAYYIYNHGSNIPPGYQYVNGTLETIDYSVGDTYTYQSGGKTKTITVTQGALDAQDNAERSSTITIHRIRPILSTTRTTQRNHG